MPRPTGKPCARCVRALTPNCDHLENTYDRALLKGLSEQDLIEYALNRMLALDRDNGNKAEGNPASRVYKSRNVITSDALRGKCDARKGALRCMRNLDHPTDDRDTHGSHKF
jgi:hypothetical protein